MRVRETPAALREAERKGVVSKIVKNFLDSQNDLISEALAEAYLLGFDHGAKAVSLFECRTVDGRPNYCVVHGVNPTCIGRDVDNERGQQ